MKHEEILHRCFRCGYCKLPSDFSDLNCPAYLKYGFESFSPGGRMWLLRAMLNNEIEVSNRFGEIMFSCATCKNCVLRCAFPKFRDYLLEAFIAGKEELLERGMVPQAVSQYLNKVQLHGNPFGISAKKRSDWIQEAGVEPYDGQEYLFFAGDVGSYDARGKEIAGCVAKLLKKCNVSFGVMASGECSDGNDVKAIGESLLFEKLAAQNIQNFSDMGVKKIITLSPHALNTFANDYPALGGDFRVFHYTQILALTVGGLEFALDQEPVTVTFHDPCYLGRHTGDYMSARTALLAVPGIQLVEMDRSRENSLCCGGGGGNFFTDILTSGPYAPAKARVCEAAKHKAQIIVTACPLCAVILEDALKVENLDNEIKVKDLSEIILERLK